MDFNTAQKKMELYGRQISHIFYRPLKISLEMASPFSVIGFLYLDGILSYLVALDVLGNDFFNLPDDKAFVMDVPLPLARFGSEKKVWHASVGFYDQDAVEGVSSWKKQFDIKHDGLIDFQGRKAKIKNQLGHFKAYNMPLVYINSNTVTFYAKGNMTELKRLLSNLEYIGKKRSQGYGKVRSVTIEKIEKDLSLFDGDRVMRSIPISEIKSDKMLSANDKQYIAFRPPYWHSNNFDECLMPVHYTNG